MSFKSTKERIIESILTISGWMTSLIVLLIIIFLFNEGLSIFGQSTTEEGFELVAHKSQQINKLSIEQIKDIFDKKIKVFKEIGGSTQDSIKTFTLDELSNLFKKEELGDSLQHAELKSGEYLNSKTNVIAYLPKSYHNKLKDYVTIDNEKVGIKHFILGKKWYPTSEPVASFGALPLILGTLWVSFGAILFALPLGLATAIYMSEIASDRVRNFLKPVVELLAGIPSVVFGFFGLAVLVPAIQSILHLPVGETGLAGSIMLGIMALPTIITISEDALRNSPRQLKEASLALGATHWQTIWRVIVPYSSSGITAAIVLGIGRAIGETMTVLMVTGNAAVIPTTFLAPLRTIPATIAAELGEAPFGGLHFKALFALGCILFVLTFFINLLFGFIGKKRLS
jgi:phosphate transport system permease protein